MFYLKYYNYNLNSDRALTCPTPILKIEQQASLLYRWKSRKDIFSSVRKITFVIFFIFSIHFSASFSILIIRYYQLFQLDIAFFRLRLHSNITVPLPTHIADKTVGPKYRWRVRVCVYMVPISVGSWKICVPDLLFFSVSGLGLNQVRLSSDRDHYSRYTVTTTMWQAMKNRASNFNSARGRRGWNPYRCA